MRCFGNDNVGNGGQTQEATTEAAGNDAGGIVTSAGVAVLDQTQRMAAPALSARSITRLISKSASASHVVAISDQDADISPTEALGSRALLLIRKIGAYRWEITAPQEC